MRAEDLSLRDLLDVRPEGGVYHFAGQRTLLFDAVALGLLRKQLIDLLGQTAARGVLTRFGFSHGWRTAEALEHALPWEDRREWRIAGGRLHKLQGLVTFEPMAEPSEGCVAEAIWRDSYEAEQHLLHLGKSEEPVCWSLIGFASGYLSYARGEHVCCMETRCVGRGDAVCAMRARRRGDWGEAEAARELAFFDVESLGESLELVARQLKEADARLQAARHAVLAADGQGHGLVARSEAMARVVELATRVARVDATVLVTGESGVGKERVARLVHDASPRQGGPFVAINCGAVPEALLESELFGHKKGAFTGATTDRPGLFEAAHTGTLFLDEVGEVPPAMQVRLLRVLQEREVRRVGENKARPVDVRIVAATHRDLQAAVEAGAIRQDFYYRLKVIEVHIPPLRERPDDVLPLARAFLSEAGARLGRDVQGFSPEAARLLLGWRWPGNVRELQNALERAVVLARGDQVGASDLPPELREGEASPRPPATDGPDPIRTLDEVEREAIMNALEVTGGNRAEAAEALGIGAATLYRRLRRYREQEG